MFKHFFPPSFCWDVVNGPDSWHELQVCIRLRLPLSLFLLLFSSFTIKPFNSTVVRLKYSTVDEQKSIHTQKRGGKNQRNCRWVQRVEWDKFKEGIYGLKEKQKGRDCGKAEVNWFYSPPLKSSYQWLPLLIQWTTLYLNKYFLLLVWFMPKGKGGA